MPEIGFTLGLLVVALVLFVTEWLRYDMVALLVLVSLNLSGILTLEESFAGFSNAAVITVAGVLVMSQAVQESGGAGFRGGADRGNQNDRMGKNPDSTDFHDHAGGRPHLRLHQ